MYQKALLLFLLGFYEAECFVPLISDPLQLIGPAFVMPSNTYDWLCVARDLPCLLPSLSFLAENGSVLVAWNVSTLRDSRLPEVDDGFPSDDVSVTWSQQFGVDSDPFLLTCLAVCQDGEWRERTSLLIRTHNKPAIDIPLSNITATELKSVTLEVAVNSTLPLTEVIWYKDGVALDVSDQSRYTGGELSLPSLTVSRPRCRDDGQYRVSVGNDAGVTNGSSIFLSVLYVPLVTVDSPTIRLPVEGTLTLTCKVKAHPKATNVTWHLQHVDDGYAVRIPGFAKGHDSIHSSVLTLSGLTREYSGIYFATAVNAMGIGRSQGVTVVVDTTLLRSPEVTVARPLLPGSRGQAKCTFNTSITTKTFPLNWVLPPGTESRASYSRRWSGGNSSFPVYQFQSILIIFPLSASDDQQEVTCQARIGRAWSTAAVSLRLDDIGPPRISVPPAIPPVLQGNPLSIACHVTSRSTLITVTWYKNGQPVGWGSRDYTGGTVATPSLSVPVSEESDTGIYVCAATNCVGQGNSTPVSVSVYVFPTATIPRVYEPIFSFLDDDVTILCNYTASRPTRLLWYHDDVIINVPGARFTGGTLHAPSLTIKGTQTTDSGQYVCEVQTALAVARSQPAYVSVDATSLPTPQVVPLGLFQRGEQEVVVTMCTYRSALPYQAEGRETPLVWTTDNPRLNSQMEVNSIRKRIGRYTQYSSALDLKGFDREDNGTCFVCTVSLKGATSHAVWTLAVEDLRTAGSS